MTHNHALPIHPRFGAALGWTSRGPIWPAAGGSPEGDPPVDPPVDPPADPPKPDDKLGEPGKAALIAERKRADVAERELAKFRKAEQDKADADKSEIQKATELREAAEAKAAAAELRVLRLEVAAEKGLSATQAKRLVGASREELETDADEFLASMPQAPPAPKGPKPDPSQGSKGETPQRPKSLSEAVSRALAPK